MGQRSGAWVKRGRAAQTALSNLLNRPFTLTCDAGRMERIVADSGRGHDPQVDDELAALNRRLDARARRQRRGELARRAARIVVRRIAQFYWLVCAAVIVIGLDAVYPAPRQRLAFAFADPALMLDRPFPSCAKAHANGYYWIPRASGAYAAGQDPDGDGRACAPSRHDLPDPLWRLRIIQDRLFAPW
jgi:hypothetical protein